MQMKIKGTLWLFIICPSLLICGIIIALFLIFNYLGTLSFNVI